MEKPTGEDTRDVRAALAFEARKPLSIKTVQMEGPKVGECQLEIKATGVRRTDEFTRCGDDPQGLFAAIARTARR